MPLMNLSHSACHRVQVICAQCADGSKCIPKSVLCNGYGDCDDDSDVSTSPLYPSSSSSSVQVFDVCLKVEYKCDGDDGCDDASDKTTSLCMPPMFPCVVKSKLGSLYSVFFNFKQYLLKLTFSFCVLLLYQLLTG